MEIELAASFDMENCLISDNEAFNSGGGIYHLPFCTGNVSRTTISRNSALNSSDLTTRGGGGILVAGGSSPSVFSVDNTIIISNVSHYGGDLYCAPQAQVYASYCNINDIYGSLSGSDNLINADPVFANPSADDFHLLYGSPCIDYGSPDYSSGGADLDGEPRPFGSRVDIGADEFTDTDGDNIADYWEIKYFGNRTNSDGTINSDADDLTDFQEYMQQTDPLKADTDGDGASDSLEVALGMNPLDPDQDNDGMADGWEEEHGLDWETDDSMLDPDLDGMDNLAEYLADTDPFDDQSFLGLLNISELWGGWRVDWKGGTDAWQMLDYSSGLSVSDVWHTVIAFPPPTPVTNALVVFGIEATDTVFRVRAQR